MMTKTIIKAMIVAMLFLQGCMVEPYEGQKFNSRASTVKFYGYVLDPGVSIRIETSTLVFPSATRTSLSPRYLATTRASTSATTFPDTYKGYYWSKSVRIPKDRWQGKSVMVRAINVQDGRPVRVYLNRWEECPELPGIAHFFSGEAPCAVERTGLKGFIQIWARNL